MVSGVNCDDLAFQMKTGYCQKIIYATESLKQCEYYHSVYFECSPELNLMKNCCLFLLVGY